MFYVRPIARDDLPALLSLSERTGTGLTSLPANAARLEHRIERSLASFAGTATQADACYVFVLIDDAKLEWFDEQGNKVEKSCTGTVELAENHLSTDFWLPKRLEPTPGSPEASDPAVLAKLDEHRAHCQDWKGRAEKFEVSMEGLPTSPIKKGDVSLSITQEKVVLESPALRCEQELWRALQMLRTCTKRQSCSMSMPGPRAR